MKRLKHKILYHLELTCSNGNIIWSRLRLEKSVSKK